MRRLFHERVRPIARHLLTILIMVLVIMQPARANVESTMNSFFSKSGAAANVNGPAAFNGQSAGYYTGGSLWARFPTEQVQPFNLQLPSVRAGCGGIDLFSGSFSFINTDQIVALMKATANNAIGYAFQLAIDSISPSIGGVMKDMSQRIQQLNQFNMNSCQMAQTLVANIAPKHDATTSRICQDMGVNKGYFTDAARARHGCDNTGERTSTLANVDPDHMLANRNYTWNALKTMPGGGVSDTYAEWLMTLVGTTIYVKGTSDSAPGKYEFIEPADSTFVNALLDGTTDGSVKVYKCNDTNCLAPALQTFTVAKATSFRQRVSDLIASMQTKVRQKNATLSEDEITLLGMTSIPLYKIITVNAAAQFGAVGDMNVISEAVAIDVLINFTEKALDDVARARVALEKVDQGIVERWSAKIQQVRTNLAERHRRAQDGLGNTYAIIQRTMHLEATLKNSLSPEMSASLSFGRSLSMSPGQ